MEQWKDINFEGYEVSSYGRVRSKDRYQTNADGKTYFYKGKYLNPTATKGRDGSSYYVVNIRQHGIANIMLVHRLVAEAFIDNPDNLPTVNHKDGDKQNNRVENLEWASYSENNKHALENNLRSPRGNPIVQKDLDGNIVGVYKSSLEAERKTGISHGGINHVLNGRAKTSGGYIWEKFEGQSTIENTDN